MINGFDYFKQSPIDHYSDYASILFDSQVERDFSYSKNMSGFQASVYNNFPDETQRYPSSSTGSDILRVLNRFLDNSQVPVCGSQIVVLVKRYPNETEVSGLVSKLRYHHASVTFVVSTNSTGGFYAETLYNLASRTNGFCSIDSDDNLILGLEQSPAYYNPYLMYAVNPIVSGKGTIQLPSYSPPLEGEIYWFTMTMQDNGPMNVVQTSLLQWTNNGNTDRMGLSNGTIFANAGGNYVCYWPDLVQDTYNVSLSFEYLDSKTRTLQIRIHQQFGYYLNFWPPYDN